MQQIHGQSNSLLFPYVFGNFRNTCLNTYNLDPAHFYSALGLAWIAALKKVEIEPELLTDNNILLLIEPGISSGICHSVLHHANGNKKYMICYYQNKDSLYWLSETDLICWSTGNFRKDKNILQNFGLLDFYIIFCF